MSTLVFYTSGHGLGHAARDIELLAAVLHRRPDTRVVLRTAAARWIFELDPLPGVELTAVEVDTGIAQIDSLTLDEGETAKRAAAFYADFDAHTDREAAVLRDLGAAAVVGDIPPLAFSAASRAGIPSIAVGNFTWDWIYAGDLFSRAAPGVIERIAEAYSRAETALRLPLHGGFESMRDVVHDVPFIARRSHRDPGDTRRALGIDTRRPMVLASFGGYGVQLPYDRLSGAVDFTLVTTDRLPAAAASDRLAYVNERELYARGFRYEDLVAAADVVVTKPGYGIVSECIANETAVLYTSRGRFREYDVFVEEMPRYVRCRFMPREELLAGNWAAHIRALLDQPAPPERSRIDGSEVAAEYVCARLGP